MDTEKIKIQSVVVNKQYMNNTKVHRMLTTKTMDYTQPIKINLDEKNNKYIFLNLDDDPSIELPRQLTPLEGDISDTIYSICKAGYDYFTIEQIARMFTGNEEKKVTPQLVDIINQSIRKMANLPQLTINLENETNHELVKKKRIHGYVLPIEYVDDAEYAANGKVTKNTVFHLLKTPILYEYAERKGRNSNNGELICVNKALLDTSKTKNSDTVEYTLLKRHILKRIQQIKHSKNALNSSRISLEWERSSETRGLLAELGYDPEMYSDWNKKRFEIIKDIKDILNYYVSIGEIKSYDTYKKPGTKIIQGFKIEY